MGLRAVGIDVHVVLSNASYMDLWEQELISAGAEVSREALVGLRDRRMRIVESISDRRQQARVAAICRDREPVGILVNQQYDEDGLDYLAGALKANVAPVAGTMHMPMTRDKDQRPFGRLRGWCLQKWYSSHPYQIIVVSAGACEELRRYYRLPTEPQTVHYGCPYKPIEGDEVRLPPNLRRDIPTVGFTGQFVTQKNLNLLVEAWIASNRLGNESQLLLVGDGPDRPSLENKLRSCGLEGWHITGWQHKPERYLNHIDLYAMTSYFEGLPLALLEAVGHGKPSVVTGFNGADDVAQRAPWVTVVDNVSTSSVADAMRSAIRNLDQLRTHAQAGQVAFRKYFSVERMAAQTLTAMGIGLSRDQKTESSFRCASQ